MCVFKKDEVNTSNMFFKDQQDIDCCIACEQYVHEECISRQYIVDKSCHEMRLFCSKHHGADGDPTVVSLNVDATCSKAVPL